LIYLLKVNWFEARYWCKKREMQMATLKTWSQREAVSRQLMHRGRSKKEQKIERVEIKIKTFRSFAAGYGFWVSASHGQFQMPDGTPVDKATWESGEPDEAGAGKETCVFLSTAYAKLLDYSCSNTRNILCEVPAALFSCFE
jgi:hypothetical protein